MKKLAIIALSVATAFMGVAPAQAFPSVASAPKIQQTTDVQTVQYWEGRRHHWRGNRGWDRGRHWDRGRYYGDRRYYRRHHRNNAGAVIGGLALGAIVGGAIANSQPRYAPAPRYYRGASSHTQWCANRYRSYRAYDNTFQPYNGPRQQCYSPY
ncbi:BA14K family protein [Rhizobium panacihumi]|uniref:BA14K family protein n=1 Tax=Rhizobium panacihumi TaxID=2008450 RepID=UPI003D7BE853